MLSWSWINCDYSGREQFYLSGHFRSPGKSTGGQWQLIIREKGNHTGISSLWWSIRMSVRIIMLDNDFKMKDISQQLWRLHETGLCLCCPVWGRHVRHIAKIVDGRWCPSVLFYSCVGDLSLFREPDRWNHFWEKLESSKSALGDLWQKVTHEMRWAPYTGRKIMTMVMMRAMMWAFTSIWCADVKDDGDDIYIMMQCLSVCL